MKTLLPSLMKGLLPACLLLACAAHTEGARPATVGAQGSTQAQAPPVSRKVKGRTLTSDESPRVEIKFAEGFKYVGGLSFILYDVADADQHFFVDADERGRVRRLYWVQFEGYLPANTHTYKYQSKSIVNVGGLDFFADSQARQIPQPDPALDQKPANKISDGDRARAFLASKGYTLASDQALWQRLVHLTDASKRRELMIIYLEDMTGTGLRAADLNEGGSAAGRWEAVSKGLLERARKGMTIKRR